MLKPVIAIAALGIAGFAGYAMNSSNIAPKNLGVTTSASTASTADTYSASPSTQWVVAAPGRVEPKSGEVRIAAGMMGRISDVYVKVNSTVVAGEVLIRLDDREARAGLAAAEAEAAARQRQRNDGKKSDRAAINDAEDAVYSAERSLTGARFGLDEALLAQRNGNGSKREVEDAEKRLERAQRQLQRERVALAVAQSNGKAPLPTMAESALSRARAEVAAADAVLAKTRIRAPFEGTVLRLSGKVGEMVAPGPQQELVLIGDTSTLRAKAEVDEADVAKIVLGQQVEVRSPSHTDKRFIGKVALIAPSLAPPQILRGPRRPSDVEVLEVTIDLDKNVPLLPGLRVDAFFGKAEK